MTRTDGFRKFLALLTLLLVGVILFGPVRGILNQEKPRFHSFTERQMFRQLTVQQNDLFGGSGLCAGCHGHDPAGLAMVDPQGNDINVVDDWKATMMANSAKDPFWRAKVSHEVLVNPGHQALLENKCTSCHAPQGRFNAAHHGLDYSMQDLLTDSLGLDGVACGACHQLDPQFVGKFFSGNLVYDTTKTVWGPYQNPFTSPMQDFIGFNVAFGAHIAKSELCASCHTLITETVDLSGNFTGGEFVEQATYHEWLNSRYADDQDDISCQSCHVPRLNENVIIAANYSFLGPRRPFGLHHMVGGNAFMLQLMKANRTILGLSADDEAFDSTIARTERMLIQQTLEINLIEASRTNDTVFYQLMLHNLTGHKFPSGYPSRRAFVQFLVMNDAGDTLFSSGEWDANYEVIGHDPSWEPHHRMINQEDQVQIYEMVMGDVNGNKTTVLERAAQMLKDNRLTPEGFSVSHPAYDTTMIAGNALLDPDFNWDGGNEGTGKDIVHYHIPLNGYTGSLNVIARVYYQSVPPGYLAEMFAFSAQPIDDFKAMFQAADNTPFKVAQVLLGDMFLGNEDIKGEMNYRVFPNPADDWVMIDPAPLDARLIQIVDLGGRLVRNVTSAELQFGKIDLQGLKGTFVLMIHAGGEVHNSIIVVR